MTKSKQTQPAFVISPKNQGYLIDALIDGKPVQWASSARNRAVNKVLRSIPANHQFMMVDMGEMKNGKV